MYRKLLAPVESQFSSNFYDYGTESSHHFDPFVPEIDVDLEATEPPPYTHDTENKECEPELAIDTQRSLTFHSLTPPSNSFEK